MNDYIGKCLYKFEICDRINHGFAGFDWDTGNKDKCQKHGVSVAEIESLFDGAVVILPDKENLQGERRFLAIGRTTAGRNVFVVFTQRERRAGILIRPISARYMHKKEVQSYEKDYPDVQDR